MMKKKMNMMTLMQMKITNQRESDPEVVPTRSGLYGTHQGKGNIWENPHRETKTRIYMKTVLRQSIEGKHLEKEISIPCLQS